MQKTITFTLNGFNTQISVEPYQTLLDALRENLGVVSPKYGCGRGECGSCTVLIDGESVRSCIVLAVEVDGCSVETLEGHQKEGLTDIQQAFIKHNSFQCGFCASGFIMSTAELLEKQSDPSEEEIKEALAGNLCRCTGYQNILSAVQEVVNQRK